MSLPRLKALLLTGLSPVWRIYLQLRGVRIGSAFTCIGRPGINLKRGSRIRLGNGVTLCNSGMANPVAEGGRCRLATVATGAELIVHDGVGMSSTLICCAKRVEIGSGTIIGGGAMILDTDFHPRLPDGNWGTDPKAVSKPVIIGKNCFIGARAIVLKGVTIGDGAVVGAGAVVSKDVPGHKIVAGNPSVCIKEMAPVP
jgi:acetyltransferase-like isoleucine patch superfamily enzyme